MSKKDVQTHDELETVDHALTSAEAFIEKNQRKIIMGVGVVVLIVLLGMSFRNFYLQPREKAAENEIAKAQTFFAVDSFKIALDGKGEVMGFKEIASKYSITSTGKLANAYAGICCFHLGKFQEAVDYLKKYSPSDDYFSTSVIGLTGDCYVELGDLSKALSYFEKAADKKNDALSPVYLKKAGLVYEDQKKPEDALKVYQTIKEKYPKSTEAADIEKYIARVQK